MNKELFCEALICVIYWILLMFFGLLPLGIGIILVWISDIIYKRKQDN